VADPATWEPPERGDLPLLHEAPDGTPAERVAAWREMVNAPRHPAEPRGIPLALRSAALRVPLAQVLAALSQIEAELQGKISQVDLSDHPNAAKLFASLAEAKKAFSSYYHHVGVALACVAPGSES
jgi:hypothetical protein